MMYCQHLLDGISSIYVSSLALANLRCVTCESVISVTFPKPKKSFYVENNKGDRNSSTGFSSEIGTKLRDWAVGQTEGSCCSQAAVSSNDSKTRQVMV